MDKYILTPIPEEPDPGKYPEHAFIDSPLVPVEENEKIRIDMQYPQLGFKNAEKRCMLRKEVHDMLQKAAAELPEGYKFVIWDAWRPFALQKELYESYSEKIIKDFHLEDLPEEERIRRISMCVANPVNDTEFPPAHTTGGAIDLTVELPDGSLAEMGTGFDSFSGATRTAFYEKKENENLQDADKIRENRRILYHIMLEHGFANLPSEWWHFDYGDMNWAHAKKQKALYKAIFSV
ncbi:MAG: M15 family metallopeptidase [Eubacterium sp.]|jgi:D-alanyl-D-alanine dipeptidase|nr:M15 family metallopeptidase [Eubacterium sp.]